MIVLWEVDVSLASAKLRKEMLLRWLALTLEVVALAVSKVQAERGVARRARDSLGEIISMKFCFHCQQVKCRCR